MKDKTFQELLESVQEAGSILRAEKEPTRVFEVAELDIKAIRKGYGMSKEKFATLLGVSRRTVEGWERGESKPKGPAHRLLQIAASHPDAVLEAACRP